MAKATDSSCCCPLMDALQTEGMGMDSAAMDGTDTTPPCMEESDETPTPSDAEATFDGSSLTWVATPSPGVPWPADMPRSFGLAAEGNAAAGYGPALYLLGCAFLN